MLLALFRGLGYSGIMFNKGIMKKELISIVKKSKSCFAWVNIYQEDGEYLQINKSTLINVVNNTTDEDMLKGLKDTFILRDDGDLYIN